PDIVDLVEYTEASRKGLEQTGVFKSYPYQFKGKANLGLYSKIPLAKARLVYHAGEKTANFANILAEFKLGGQRVSLIVAHPHLPWKQNLAFQRLQFGAWIKERKTHEKNLVLVGDLNTTPWSRNFRQLVDKTDLRDSQLGFGLQGSWPAILPSLGHSKPSKWFGLARIPIDHVLISRTLAVFKRETGPYVGSDHLPVFAELGLRQGS
ncbi:MAG: endonuclease/exonuclease/phosphatase family protein, partial [Candidatus Sericytochromatia bacterium]